MKIIQILILAFLLMGCAEVQSWQKGDLARSHMSTDSNPANSRFTHHLYQSKEGAIGGYGIAAGGCGCN